MAKVKMSANVDIDMEKKIIYVDIDKLTEEEKAVVELNTKTGYTALLKPKKARKRVSNGKKNVRSVKDWQKTLTKEQFDEFKKVQFESGFLKANYWALEQIGK